MLVSLMIIGAIQYGLMYLLVLRAYQYLDAHQVVLFTVTTPLYVYFFDAMDRRYFSIRHFLIAILALIGGVLIYQVHTMSHNVLYGFCLVQAADICFSYGQVAYRKIRHLNPDVLDQEIYAFLFLGASVLSSIPMICFNSWQNIQDLSFKQTLIILYLGVIASGVCFFWWNKGALKVHPVVLAVFNNLKLPLATIVSIVFFHEELKINASFVLGFVFIFLALYLARYCHRDESFSTGAFIESKKTV